MRLLRSIRVRNFRSLRDVGLDDLSDYTTLIGTNGTGKSNMLRALCLFFTGGIDERGTTVDLDRDFPAGVHEKRQIAVRVEFDLPQTYKLRALDDLQTRFGVSRKIVVERLWRYSNIRAIEQLLRIGIPDGDLVDVESPGDQALAQALIHSVRFRYIPNHVQPAELMRQESVLLRRRLLTRVKQGRRGPADEALRSLAGASSDLLESVSTRIARGTQGRLKGLRIEVPKDLGELLFEVVLRAMTEAGPQVPELQGSGIQSYMLLHLLSLLDREERASNFGWLQSTVWAWEEPESFLHAGLRSRFAEDLGEYSKDQWRQVFVTTHEDDFVRVGDRTWLTDLEAGRTVARGMSSREGLALSTKLRVTRYSHPLMLEPDVPLVLVEGPTDRDYLSRAATAADLRPRWKLHSLPELDETTGGGQALLDYLRMNKHALQSRPDDAPVIVLRDWEDAGRNKAVEEAISVHPYSRLLCCPKGLANPQLGQSFKGIERYLPTQFVESSLASSGVLQPASITQKYPLELSARANREAAKKTLSLAFGTQEPGPFLERLVRWLDGEVTSAMAAVPAESFL